MRSSRSATNAKTPPVKYHPGAINDTVKLSIISEMVCTKVCKRGTLKNRLREQGRQRAKRFYPHKQSGCPRLWDPLIYETYHLQFRHTTTFSMSTPPPILSIHCSSTLICTHCNIRPFNDIVFPSIVGLRACETMHCSDSTANAQRTEGHGKIIRHERNGMCGV